MPLFGNAVNTDASRSHFNEVHNGGIQHNYFISAGHKGFIMSLQPGVYLIRNLATQTVVDLSSGSSTNGTQVQGWHQHPFDHGDAYNQLWYIQPIPGAGSYTLYNLKSGTVLDLSDGGSAEGTQVQGWVRHTDPTMPDIHNQEWFFKQVENNIYNIVNVRSGTSLHLSGGCSADGTKIQGWPTQPGNPNQMWKVEHRISPKGN